ncbi:MAG: glycosyltransferase [Anaerolineae bacterium]|nr:glycosyltransferase [Anaerolineae bacterium]
MINPQKHIAIFMPSLFGAGGQRSMLNLAHGMADSGYAVDLVLAQAEGAFMSEVRSSVRVVDLKASRALTSFPALVRYLRREQPDAMLSVFGYVNIIALWAWRLASVRTRLLVNEQNTVSMEAGNAASWRSRMVPWLMKRFYPWANGIVVVSNGVRDDMARSINIDRERITVIYNPSVVRAEVLEKAQAPLDHPWFEPDQPPVLVAVGRLQPQKDYPMLLRAFAQVRRTRQARLVILGEGKERPMLEALIKELGLEQDVSLPGFVMNPFAYMARASLFVLSSRWEGLPTVLIEALCCGTKVVSTDCPSGPQEILSGGKYGQLVPVGDADAFARAIEKALTENTQRPPSESWQPYELETVVSQYTNLLLGENGRNTA